MSSFGEKKLLDSQQIHPTNIPPKFCKQLSSFNDEVCRYHFPLPGWRFGKKVTCKLQGIADCNIFLSL